MIVFHVLRYDTKRIYICYAGSDSARAVNIPGIATESINENAESNSHGSAGVVRPPRRRASRSARTTAAHVSGMFGTR